MRALGGEERALQHELGGVNSGEQSFCQDFAYDHFNKSSHVSGSDFRKVDTKDPSDVAVAALVEQLSAGLARSSHLRGVRRDGFTVRSTAGWQFSFGGRRGWHVDLPHLGSVIVTITLEGDCTIEVDDCLVEDPQHEEPWRPQPQTPGCFYAIWGPSRDDPIRHRVLAGERPRLSLTMRYLLHPDVEWKAGDRCEARCQAQHFGEKRTNWYPGSVSCVYPDERRCDIAYDDGDSESRVPWLFLRKGDGGQSSQLRSQRKRRFSEHGVP